MHFIAAAAFVASNFVLLQAQGIPAPNCGIFQDIQASSTGVTRIINFFGDNTSRVGHADPSSGGGTGCSWISEGTENNLGACAYLCSNAGSTPSLSFGKAAQYVSVILASCDTDENNMVAGNIAGNEGDGNFIIDLHKCTP